MGDLPVRGPAPCPKPRYSSMSIVGLSAARSDVDLLAAFATRRDQEAFRRLVERYSPLVAGICRRILSDAHAAEDAVQTTFLALARRPKVVRGDTIAGWLCAVARRTCLKFRRTDSRRKAREVAAARPAGSLPSMT